MLEQPAIQDETIVAAVHEAYGLPGARVEFLPLGVDPKAAVYRVVARDGAPYFLKLRWGDFDELCVLLPKLLSDQGIAQIIPPLAYYRYERIIQDIAAFCEEILFAEQGGADRAQALRYLAANFLPGGTLALAHASDNLLHERNRSMRTLKPITPCLWFEDQAEAAAAFYTGIFPNSRIVRTTHYSEAGQEIHGKPAGAVMTVAFELDGQPFTALNGGPAFTLSEAISFEVHCATQDELDYYWERLGAGGDPAAQQCGWLKDQYGVSWQIIPTALIELINDPDAAKARRVTEVMLRMQKLEIAELQRAYDA